MKFHLRVISSRGKTFVCFVIQGSVMKQIMLTQSVLLVPPLIIGLHK
jgi:hypothetical protein